tara:strand:+ start:63 stop:260 length:198 start_codon:yes stop_codon:yes gene_type:complete
MNQEKHDKLIEASLDFCKTLKGSDRYDFIDEALDDYRWTTYVKSPREVQRQFRELFSKLVKNFGH